MLITFINCYFLLAARYVNLEIFYWELGEDEFKLEEVRLNCLKRGYLVKVCYQMYTRDGEGLYSLLD